MWQILFLLLPGIVGIILRCRGVSEIYSWLAACTIIPLLILIEKVLPYHGGGASMWPIALAVGSFCGAMSGGLGVVIGSFYLKRKNRGT